MQIKRIETLISKGAFVQSEHWQIIRQSALKAVISADWPPGSGKFTIYPQSGKKTGEGNGVKPIKNNVINTLSEGKPNFRKMSSSQREGLLNTWVAEYPWPINEHDSSSPGPMDAAYICADGIVCFEWETGNISSSHRSLNKMCLGLYKQAIKGGFLVVPSRQLYPYLTDRIGNISELEPYFDLWRSIPCEEGVLEIIVIEHDGTSFEVPKIPKGTDGRANV